MVESPTSDSLASASTQQDSSQYVGFELAGQHYAFRIEQIQEIVILDQVTPTPNVADCVEGVSNLRGSIIPVINLRQLMGMEAKPRDSDTRTIVVNVGQRTVGCTVDVVTQVMRIAADDVQPPPSTVTAGGAHYISGFAKVAGALVVLLDIDELLNPEGLKRPGG